MAVLYVKDQNGKFVPIPSLRGRKGDTPVRGVDYWTEEDVQQIQGYIDEEISDVRDEVDKLNEEFDTRINTLQEIITKPVIFTNLSVYQQGVVLYYNNNESVGTAKDIHDLIYTENYVPREVIQRVHTSDPFTKYEYACTNVDSEVYQDQNSDAMLMERYTFHFGDNAPPIIVDCVTNTITLDPDWVAPKKPAEPSGPHRQLVTDADGNKVWEEKLAYQFENRTEIMNETAYTGEKTELNKNGTPVLSRSIFSGENFVVICDDTEYRVTSVYSPSLKATVMGNASLAEVGEDTGEPFFIDNTGYNKNSYVYFSSDGEHTLSIFEVVVGYKTLPENFLAKKPFAARIHHNISANIPQLNYIQCSSPSSEIHKVLSQDTDYSNVITLLWYNASESIKFNRTLTGYTTDNLGTNNGLRYWLYFGDDIAPYIMDVYADTIIVDPDWVAPEESATKSDIDQLTQEIQNAKITDDYINQLIDAKLASITNAEEVSY